MVGMSVLSAFSQITYHNKSAHLNDYRPRWTDVLGYDQDTSDESSLLQPFASLGWGGNNPGQFDARHGRM